MPKIPVYEQQVQVRAPQVRTTQISAPVQAAFGQDIARANERMGATISGIGEMVSKHAIQMKEEDDKAQVFDARKKFAAETFKLLNDSEQDPESNLPKGFMQRRLNQASGALVQFDSAFQALEKKYTEGFANDSQRSLFMRASAADREAFRDKVGSHEASQVREWKIETAKSAMQASLSKSAILTKPEALAANIAESHAIMDQSLAFQGLDISGRDKAMADQKKAELTGAHAKEAVNATLESNPAQSRAILNAFRDRMPANVAEEISRQIDGKEFDTLRQKTWGSLIAQPGMVLADGTPDLGRMRQAVYGMKNIAGDKQEKLISYLEARGNDMVADRKRQDAATDYQFMEEALKLKGAGAKLETAERELLGKFKGDNSKTFDRETTLRKLYTSRQNTEPAAYLDLWRKAKDQTLSPGELEKAFQKGALAQDDFLSLNKINFDASRRHEDTLMKMATERVQILADENFSRGQSKQKEQFLYMAMKMGVGKSPEEFLTLANDLLQKDPASGRWFQDPKWETEIKKDTAQMQYWGMIHSQVGEKETDALLRGISKGQGEKVTAQDLEGVLQSLGGFENFKQGSAPHNAVKSLMARNKRVTLSNIQSVLKNYPTGVIQDE